jgi:hypothetical protein
VKKTKNILAKAEQNLVNCDVCSVKYKQRQKQSPKRTQENTKREAKGKREFVKYITVINKVVHSYIREIRGYSDNLTKVRVVPLDHT